MRTRYIAIACLGMLLPGLCAAQPTSQRLRDRISDGARDGAVSEAIRHQLLEGVAAYPDEVIAAIFAVAQEPAALLGRQPGSAEFARAHDFLRQFPRLLDSLKETPLATAALGRIAKRNPEGAWATIDEIRSAWNAGATSAPSEGTVVISPLPQSVQYTNGSTATGTTSTSAPASTQTTESAEQVTVIVAGAAQSAEAVAQRAASAFEQTYITEGSSTVAGPSNSASAEWQGATVVNPVTGEASSAYAGTASTSTGRSVTGTQQGQTSFDSDSYEHSGSGSVATAQGQGGEWSRDSSGQATDTGFSQQSGGHYESKSGDRVDVEHATDVTKTDDGYDVDHSGNATTSGGKSADWNRSADYSETADGGTVERGFSGRTGEGKSLDTAASAQIRQGAESGSMTRQRNGETGAGEQFSRSSAAGYSGTTGGREVAWGEGSMPDFSSFAKGGSSAYSRQGGTQGFSMEALDAGALTDTLNKAQGMQKSSFGKAESSLGAGAKPSFDAPPRGGREGGGRSGGGSRGGGRGGR